MATKYTPLEPSFSQAVAGKELSYDGNSVSLFTSTSFLYTLFFVIIVLVASSQYVRAGILRMEASESGIRKSNDLIKKTTYGLLGVFGLWLILNTVNKDLLLGDVGLGGFRSKGGGSVAQVVPNISNASTNTTGSGSTEPCGNVEDIKKSLNEGVGICGNKSCSLTSCLQNNKYTEMVKKVAGNDWKMALVILCKESSGNKDAQNKNPNGTYDCGLMQVNQPGPCDATSLDPEKNISRGVTRLQEKMKASSNAAIYPELKVGPEAAVFTSYNCCANGTIPNDASASCKTSDGWPSIPKWACPIDPGTGKFNMCGVKAYACELTACLGTL